MENNKLQDVASLVKKELEGSDFKHFSKNQKRMLVAYAQASCNATHASQLCGMTRASFYKYMNDAPKPEHKHLITFKEYIEQIQEMDLDFAEGQLKYLMKGQYIYKKDEDGKLILDAEGDPIREYIQPIDTTAVIFKLKTHGKKRGYTQRTEITGAEGQPLGGFEINIKRKKDRS